MKTSDAKIIGKFSVRRSTDDTIQANRVIVLPPVPLRTFWKTIEVKLNESLVTPADNFAYMGSYLSFLTCETPDTYVDSKEVNCSYLDTQGEMDTRAGNNLGSIARHALTNYSVTTLIDPIDCAGFSENGGVTYIPSAFKTEIRLTRGKMDLVCMGTAHADLALATIAIEDLQIRIPVYKPKAQLTAALNTSFVKNSQEAKYYTTTFRTVTTTIGAGKRRMKSLLKKRKEEKKKLFQKRQKKSKYENKTNYIIKLYRKLF